MKNKHDLVEALTGMPLVEPGHPLVLAVVIMERFSNIRLASSMNAGGEPAAVECGFIPGSSSHIGAALRILKQAYAGASVEKSKREADLYWRIGQAGGVASNVQAGLYQAEVVQHHFERRSASWLRSCAS